MTYSGLRLVIRKANLPTMMSSVKHAGSGALSTPRMVQHFQGAVYNGGEDSCEESGDGPSCRRCFGPRERSEGSAQAGIGKAFTARASRRGRMRRRSCLGTWLCWSSLVPLASGQLLLGLTLTLSGPAHEVTKAQLIQQSLQLLVTRANDLAFQPGEFTDHRNNTLMFDAWQVSGKGAASQGARAVYRDDRKPLGGSALGSPNAAAFRDRAAGVIPCDLEIVVVRTIMLWSLHTQSIDPFPPVAGQPGVFSVAIPVQNHMQHGLTMLKNKGGRALAVITGNDRVSRVMCQQAVQAAMALEYPRGPMVVLSPKTAYDTLRMMQRRLGPSSEILMTCTSEEELVNVIIAAERVNVSAKAILQRYGAVPSPDAAAATAGALALMAVLQTAVFEGQDRVKNANLADALLSSGGIQSLLGLLKFEADGSAWLPGWDQKSLRVNECSAGTIFNPYTADNSSDCLACPAGWTNAPLGEWCEECAIGSFARTAGSSCSLCPSGADCTDSGTAVPGPLPDFYRFDTPAQLFFVPCLPNLCLGNNQCQGSNTGALCMSCLPGTTNVGFIRGQFQCASCWPGGLLVVVLLMYLSVLYFLVAVTASSTVTGMIWKRVINYWQLCSAATHVGQLYLISGSLQLISDVVLYPFHSILGPDCLFAGNYQSETFVFVTGVALMPVLVTLTTVFFIIYSGIQITMQSTQRRGKRIPIRQLLHETLQGATRWNVAALYVLYCPTLIIFMSCCSFEHIDVPWRRSRSGGVARSPSWGAVSHPIARGGIFGAPTPPFHSLWNCLRLLHGAAAWLRYWLDVPVSHAWAFAVVSASIAVLQGLAIPVVLWWNEYIKESIKRFGRRFDHEERMRKKKAREPKRLAGKGRLRGIKAKLFTKKRYSEKATMKKTIKAHQEKDAKAKDAEEVKPGAVPAYLLDREQVRRTKVLSNMIKQKRKEKAGKWQVPIPKVKAMTEDEMFKILRSGKRKKKAWKRIVNKVSFVGDNFTRKPPKFERYIRPSALRFKKAHVTHPELKMTFNLEIVSVKKNPQSALYTNLGVITKGTIIEVNVSELGLVTQTGKVIFAKYAQVTNNPDIDGCINSLLLIILIWFGNGLLTAMAEVVVILAHLVFTGYALRSFFVALVYQPLTLKAMAMPQAMNWVERLICSDNIARVAWDSIHQRLTFERLSRHKRSKLLSTLKSVVHGYIAKADEFHGSYLSVEHE
eukprot:g30147.t1